MRGRTPMTCRRWITIFFATWAVLSGLLVLLAGVALNLPFRKWLLPYLTYCACGIVLAPALYWARRAYDRPKSGAMRLAAVIFFFLQIFMLALAFNATNLGILRGTMTWRDYALFILPGSAVGSITVYLMGRRKLEATKNEWHRMLKPNAATGRQNQD